MVIVAVLLLYMLPLAVLTLPHTYSPPSGKKQTYTGHRCVHNAQVKDTYVAICLAATFPCFGLLASKGQPLIGTDDWVIFYGYAFSNSAQCVCPHGHCDVRVCIIPRVLVPISKHIVTWRAYQLVCPLVKPAHDSVLHQNKSYLYSCIHGELLQTFEQ
jgi:hypothetical protein